MTDNNIELHLGDNLKILKEIKKNSIDLIYIDPPFNTGKIQSRTQIKTTRSEDGDRIGFKGQSYKGIISHITDYGMFVEITKNGCEVFTQIN